MKLGVLVLAGACTLTWLPSTGPTSRMETHGGIDTLAVRGVIHAVNELRAKGCYCPGNKWFGPVKPLRVDERLNRAAQAHAEDMRQRKYFSHHTPEGWSAADRADQAGYLWSLIGENIAWGQPTPESVVESWQKSLGHCENMMHANYQHMGLGRASTYWVQMLGSPKRR